jgi:hypothetical protein
MSGRNAKGKASAHNPHLPSTLQEPAETHTVEHTDDSDANDRISTLEANIDTLKQAQVKQGIEH